MFKRLLGRVAAIALAAGVCFGAVNMEKIDASAVTGFFDKGAVQMISLNQKASGRIMPENDKWLSFTSANDENIWYTLHFKSNSRRGARCKLYDEDGASSDYMEVFDNTHMQYVTQLKPASTYYIQVYSIYHTDIDFTVEVTTEADEGGSVQTALPIGNEYSGTLAHGTDIDYLAFNSGENTACTVTVKNIDGNERIFAQVFNADETMVEEYFSIDKAKAESQTLLLKKNTTYFLKIKNNANWNNRNRYSVSISGRKDESGTKKQAQKIKLKKELKGVIDAEKDEDWFKVKLNKKKNWKFILKNINAEANVQLTIFKGNKELGYVNCGTARSDSKKLRLKKGTYYIKVSGAKGNYSFKVK